MDPLSLGSCTSAMDILNNADSSIKMNITRLKMYIEIINDETDSIEQKKKLTTDVLLQNCVQKLRNKYYLFPNIKDTQRIPVEDELNQI